MTVIYVCFWFFCTIGVPAQEWIFEWRPSWPHWHWMIWNDTSLGKWFCEKLANSWKDDMYARTHTLYGSRNLQNEYPLHIKPLKIEIVILKTNVKYSLDMFCFFLVTDVLFIHSYVRLFIIETWYLCILNIKMKMSILCFIMGYGRF